MDFIIYLGISQSFFAAIITLSKKRASQSDKLLTAWLFLLGIEFISCALDLFFFESSLLSSVFLLTNPAFFLYIKSLTTKSFKLKYLQLLHLLPYLFFEISSYFIQKPFDPGFLSSSHEYFGFNLSFAIFNIASWLFYNIASIILVAKHRASLKDEFSNIDTYKSIAWLLFVLIYYIIYCGSALILGLLAINLSGFSELPQLFTYSVMLSLAYILGFYGLRQNPIHFLTANDEITPLISKKYKSSSLNKKDIDSIKSTILVFFENEKPYLNPEFSMSILSKKVNVPKHYLTQVLNMEIGYNFFSFVNKYRVKEVKKLLMDKDLYYSIEAIGYECGFNSKSVFFTVFKSQTGFTPLQFKNKQSK